MKVMKIYLSGPVSGLRKEDYVQLFGMAEQYVSLQGHTVVNPLKLHTDNEKSNEENMKEDIRALLECDCIYMLKGWEKSRRARVEHAVAEAIGLTVIPAL